MADATIRWLPGQMRLRRFQDPTLQGAMAQVRAALGPEALILASRRIAGGVEVTAALDDAPEETFPAAAITAAPPSRPAHLTPRRPTEPPAPPPVESSVGEQARLSHLEWHGVPLALARRLRAGPLAFALSLTLRFAALDLADATPMVLVGPPGAGKTLTVVRLATRLVLAGIRPLVICADGARAGAAEQLVAFTRLLGVELLEAASPTEALAILRARAGAGPVLVDTPGGEPWAEAAEPLRDLAGNTKGRLLAVLPAGLDPAEAADLAAGYAELGASALVATRLDVARRLGGVLSAAATGLAFVEAGVGAGAADGLVPATPDLLARRLLATPPGRRKERSA